MAMPTRNSGLTSSAWRSAGDTPSHSPIGTDGSRGAVGWM